MGWTRALHEAGLAVIRWPRQWGGSDASATDANAVAEVLAAAGAPLPLSDIGINLVGPSIMLAGTEDQRKTHLPPIASGSVVWTQLFSEPDAGSDLAAVRTRARPDGPAWVVNGQKVWSTYAHLADWGYLIARTGTMQERHRGLTIFLLPMDSRGIRVRPIRSIAGDFDFNEVFLEDVRLGPEQVLGEPGAGWQIAMGLLTEERHVTGRQVIGLAAEMDRLTSLIDADENPDFAFLAGELCAEVAALLSLTAAQEAQDGLAAMTKIAFSELNIDVHQLALDFTASYRRPVPAGWRHRWLDSYWNTRGYTISGGSNEVLRNVIARRVLGLPSS